MAVLNKYPAVLELGVPFKLGTFTATGDQLRFSLPVESLKYSGRLGIQAVPDGALTTFTANVKASLNGGVTYDLLSGGSAVDMKTTPFLGLNVDGLGGVPLEISANAITLGAATKIDIWVTVG